MIKNILQSDSALIEPIRKYGCLFLCLAYTSPVLFDGQKGCAKLNSLWKEAERKGYISGDLNKDGDYDDAGEAEVQTHDGLLSLFGIKAKYHGHTSNPSDYPNEKVNFIFGVFKYSITHFVVINGKDDVIYDPAGHSYTVKHGKLVQRRYYYADKIA